MLLKWPIDYCRATQELFRSEQQLFILEVLGASPFRLRGLKRFEGDIIVLLGTQPLVDSTSCPCNTWKSGPFFERWLLFSFFPVNCWDWARCTFSGLVKLNNGQAIAKPSISTFYRYALSLLRDVCAVFRKQYEVCLFKWSFGGAKVKILLLHSHAKRGFNISKLLEQQVEKRYLFSYHAISFIPWWWFLIKIPLHVERNATSLYNFLVFRCWAIFQRYVLNLIPCLNRPLFMYRACGMKIRYSSVRIAFSSLSRKRKSQFRLSYW